jgi:hypothetical protein
MSRLLPRNRREQGYARLVAATTTRGARHHSGRLNSARGPGADDSLTLTLGDLPADLITTLREWRAQINGLLDQAFGGATSEQAFLRYREDLATVELPEFDDRYPSWLSVRLCRPLRVKARKGATIAWLDEPPAAFQALAEFDSEGAHFLDGVVTRLFLPSTTAESRLDPLQRASCLPDGFWPCGGTRAALRDVREGRRDHRRNRLAQRSVVGSGRSRCLHLPSGNK